MNARDLTRRFVVLRGLRWMPLGIVLPFIILLPQARGLSLPTIGALWAIHSVVTLVLEVPSGALADGYGRRRVLLAGAVLMVAALAVYAVAEAPPAFAVALVLLATGRALTSGALDAWYVDTLRAAEPGASLRVGLARGGAADAIGLTVGALAGGFLPLAFGGLDRSGEGFIFYSPVTLIAAGVAVVYLAALLLLVDEAPRPPADVSLRGRLSEVSQATGATLRTSAVLRRLLVTASAFGSALMAVELLWQPRLAELLDDAREHSVLFGLLVAGSMAVLGLGAALSPRITGWLGARRAYMTVVVATALTLAALAAAWSPFTLAAAFLVLYAVLGLGDPVHFELLHEATSDSIRATVLSAESLATQAGGVVSNLALGALAGSAGVPAAWLVVAAIVALSSLAVLRLPTAS